MSTTPGGDNDLSVCLARGSPRRLEQLLKRAVVRRSLPDALRLAAYSRLLGAPAESAALAAALAAAPLDALPNQRVVVADASRTRPDQPGFRSPAMQARIVRLLSFYCVSTQVPYRQGLNELLAPFVMLRGGEDGSEDGSEGGCEGGSSGGIRSVATDAAIFSAFSRLVARFAPRNFASASDGDFTSLQCSLRLLGLLLRYHDPRLHAFMDQFECSPELYATPWLLTLFARSLPRAELFALWDLLLASSRRPGPALLHCLAVAFLMSHREAIFATLTRGTVAAELPIVVSRLAFSDEAHVRRTFAQALELYAQTPISFRRLIYNVCYSGEAAVSSLAGGAGAAVMRVSPALLARLERRMCVKISVEELLVGTGSRFAVAASSDASRAAVALRSHRALPSLSPTSPTSRASGEAGPTGGPVGDDAGLSLLLDDANWDVPPRYFLLDVRSREEFLYGGHLPTAFHLDDSLLHDPERLDSILRSFAGLRGVHFAVMGAGDVSQWYHAPVAPHSKMSDDPAASAAAAAATAADQALSALAEEGAEDAGGAAGSPLASPRSGAGASAAAPTASSSAYASAEHDAVRHGLDPLSADEEDDYGTGDRSRAFVALFLQRGFTRVSEVEGGFTALHQHQAHFLDETLVAHEKGFCMVCTGGGASALYAGRNALERGVLLQASEPFRILRGGAVAAAGAAGAAASAAAAAATAAATAARIVASRSANSLLLPPPPSAGPVIRRDNSLSGLEALASWVREATAISPVSPGFH